MDSGTTPPGSQPTPPPRGCYAPGQDLSGGALSLTTSGGTSSALGPVGGNGGAPTIIPTCLGPEAGAVVGVLTIVASDGSVTVNTQFLGVLPVDVAVSNDGSVIAAVAPGNAFTSSLSTVFEFAGCGDAANSFTAPTLTTQATAVAFDPSNHLVVQTREPASLMVFNSAGNKSATINLSNATRADTGFDVFHTQAGGMIACGSCHPEGGDDGHVWLIDGNLRRTPSLRGTIPGTAPYHWPGDEPSLDVLVDDVYTHRMSGTQLSMDQMSAIKGWVQSIPAASAPSWIDLGAAARGKTLFDSASVGCATCHSGAKFTNNQTMDVGTGGAFQVPPLVGIGWRAPFMHDGCAATLADRFGACSTPLHGSIGSLTRENISDLVAYLETL
jgi:cytochrome c553